MEGLTVLQLLVGLMVFFGFVAVVVVVYAWGIRWLWRERGKAWGSGVAGCSHGATEISGPRAHQAGARGTTALSRTY